MKALVRSVAAVFLATLTLSGCGVSCEPTSIAMDVKLALTSEQTRTLPILASGKTSVAGVEIPDSHGVLDWDVSFTDDRVNVVDVQDLRLEISIMGNSVPVQIVKVEGMDSSRLYDRDHVRIWWTVDPHRATPVERALHEGDSYQAKIRFHWSLDGCQYSGDGIAEAVNPGFVQPSVITTTFNPTSGAVSTSGANASYEAHASIKNGISTTIQKVTAVALGLGDVPGTVLWTQSTVTVNGLPVSSAAPGDDVGFSGSPLPTSGAAPWLLVLYVEHQSTSGPGTQRDTLAWFE
jgi:hypothetical protein